MLTKKKTAKTEKQTNQKTTHQNSLQHFDQHVFQGKVRWVLLLLLTNI